MSNLPLDLMSRGDPIKVFISSRMNGTLDAERSAAARVVDAFPFARSWLWEKDAAAGPYCSEEVCVEQAATSDALILLLEDELSPITRKEYEAARRTGAAIFVLIKQGVKQPPDVEAFIADVRRRHVTKDFHDVSEVESAIEQALAIHGTQAWRWAVAGRRDAYLAGLTKQAWELNARALQLHAAGRTNDAVAAWGDMRAMGLDVEDEAVVSTVAHNLGTVAHRAGDTEEARNHYLAALQSKLAQSDVLAAAEIMVNLSLLDHTGSDGARAEDDLRRLEPTVRALAHPGLSSAFYGNLATFIAERRDFRTAERLLRRSMKFAKESGEADHLVIGMRNIGILRLNEGRQRPALGWFKRALSLAESEGSARESQALHRHVAATLHTLGRTDEAIPHLERLQEIAREREDEVELARVCYELGSAHIEKDQVDRGIALLEESIERSSRLGDRSLESDAVRNLIIAKRRLKQFDEAQRLVDRLLALLPRKAYRARWDVLRSAAVTWLTMGGEGKKASRYFDRALLSLAHQASDNELAWETNMVGAILRDNGAPDLSLPYFERAKGIYAASGNDQMVFHVGNDHGTALAAVGRDTDAIHQFQECAAIARRLDEPDMLYTVMLNLGEMDRRRERYDTAETSLREAVTLALYRENVADAQVALSNLGLTLLNAERWCEAADAYIQLRDIALETGSRERRREALEGLAFAHIGAGRFDEAVEVLRQAITISESMGDIETSVRDIGALGECYARLGRRQSMRRTAQRLVDLASRSAQIGRASSTAVLRIARTELILEHEDTAELFAVGILLHTNHVESDTLNDILVPFVVVAHIVKIECPDRVDGVLDAVTGALTELSGAPREAIQRLMAAAQEVTNSS